MGRPTETLRLRLAAAGEDFKLARPGRSHAVVTRSGPAVVNIPPETDDEPGTEDDAAEEQKNSKKRPKDHPGRDRRYQRAKLPPGSRSYQGTPGSQRGLGTASCASH